MVIEGPPSGVARAAAELATVLRVPRKEGAGGEEAAAWDGPRGVVCAAGSSSLNT